MCVRHEVLMTHVNTHRGYRGYRMVPGSAPYDLEQLVIYRMYLTTCNWPNYANYLMFEWFVLKLFNAKTVVYSLFVCNLYVCICSVIINLRIIIYVMISDVCSLMKIKLVRIYEISDISHFLRYFIVLTYVLLYTYPL